MRYSARHHRLDKNARMRAFRAARRDERSKRERATRDALKRRMIEYLGSACSRCARTLSDFGHPAAFDFHHRDWREKSFSFSGNYGRRWEVLRAELDKCDLYCACCHRIVEATRPDPQRPRGRPPLPWKRSGHGPDSAEEHYVENAARRRVDAREAHRQSFRRDQLALPLRTVRA
jgi:hypothetical protein